MILLMIPLFKILFLCLKLFVLQKSTKRSNLCPEILHNQVNHFTSHSPLFIFVIQSCHNHILGHFSQLFIS